MWPVIVFYFDMWYNYCDALMTITVHIKLVIFQTLFCKYFLVYFWTYIIKIEVTKLKDDEMNNFTKERENCKNNTENDTNILHSIDILIQTKRATMIMLLQSLSGCDIKCIKLILGSDFKEINSSISVFLFLLYLCFSN